MFDPRQDWLGMNLGGVLGGAQQFNPVHFGVWL
jgi:hypothetical protein